MKFEGFREVKCICYPNDFVVVEKKKVKLLNMIIFNFLLCIVVAAAVVGIKFFGGKALEVLDIISEALTGASPF